MDTLIQKAATLHEALPYIQRFQGRIFVVKYGGHAMIDENLKRSFARDVALLRCVGIQVVVVHGGGPQINEALTGMGIEPTFQGGLRVTDDKTMQVVEMVLAGQINSEIVGLISEEGARAVGISGKDDGFLRARRKAPASVTDSSGQARVVDLGRVGEVDSVSPDLLRDLLKAGYLPVVAPVGKGPNGEALNVNADTAAGRIAAALGATKLMLMTDVAGVKDKNGDLVRELVPGQTEAMIADGVITGGMIPKVRCALDAVLRGVSKVHIVDGRTRHALLLEIFTDMGVGTEIKPA
jgi:acetylglutamate kinase